MPASRPGRGRQNEEEAWGFEARRISEGLGAFGALGSSKGLGVWALSRNTISPRAYSGGGKKGKNQKLKRTKTQHPQRLLFHFMLVLFCYIK